MWELKIVGISCPHCKHLKLHNLPELILFATKVQKKKIKMSESSNKQLKVLQNLPDELMVRSLSFLPIQSLLQTRVVSKLFRHTEIRSLDLDFSRIFSVERSQLEVTNIIQNVFNKHEGMEINRFVLCPEGIDWEESVTSWINTCIGKNIQEIVLDFSKSREVVEIPIDFSAIKTLTVLNLRWCKFDEIPNNSPEGLKLLKKLSLVRTMTTKEMVDAIFTNCIHLELLELIECGIYGILTIPAPNHKKFKSLVLSTMTNITDIVVHAPTLEYFKYEGYVTNITFSTTDALKEANIHYKRNRHIYDPSDMVISNMKDYTKVYVLATTNIFLEALIKRHVGGGRLERKGTFKFENLTDFKISFNARSFCTLFEIAEFLNDCPKVERLVIDIQNFEFADRLEFWEIHLKEDIENNNYLFMFLNEVKIIGYKNHWHELDIVEFFVKNAPALVKVDLEMPKNSKTKVHQPDNARINVITSKFPAIKVTEV
ncbi:PREDICTED: FBD-associated F-box protein At1g61320-like [Camelina sativa]|uniref:FBD-associated F-box protein At1g61320-like n=1 Tax=Camelina sativa TaxID=90675 RepID=A0ABM0SRB1_CAMSA|nr:PREDICTED: FBD-associated F-box protein At1g61320-like [Camelina sativa]